MPGAYRVEFKRRAWEQFCQGTPPNIVRVAEDVRDTFLAINPEDRVAARGKLKVLKGPRAGILQYDLPNGYRLWYTVDRNARTVRVLYIGPHP